MFVCFSVSVCVCKKQYISTYTCVCVFVVGVCVSEDFFLSLNVYVCV